MKYVLPLATLLMTAWLDSDKEDTDEEEKEEKEEKETTDFTPSEGLWAVPSPEFTSDTCGFGDEGDTGGEDISDGFLAMGEMV